MFSWFFQSGGATINGFNSATHLTWGNVEADSPVNPSIVKIRLKKSKTDQLGRGVDVFVGRTGNAICPVEAITSYVMVRGADSGPFFRFEDLTPLTKPKFVARVREVLQALGLPYNCFAGHSFRIGAATAAAQAGIEDSVIQLLGRWSSAAFLSYVRTPRDQLARYSSAISILT